MGARHVDTYMSNLELKFNSHLGAFLLFIYIYKEYIVHWLHNHNNNNIHIHTYILIPSFFSDVYTHTSR